MIPTLKAEFKKLLSVRSTYFILLFVLALEIFFAFYITGWRIEKHNLVNPFELASQVGNAISVISIFSAVTAILLVTHEYRYNTIMYSLTLSNSRSKVLLAKVIVATVYAVIFTLFFGTLSPILTYLAIHAHHLKLVPQTYYYFDIIWRNLLYGWGFTMAGLLFATLIRSQVGSIVALFIIP